MDGGEKCEVNGEESCINVCVANVANAFIHIFIQFQ